MRVLVLGHTHRQWACDQASSAVQPEDGRTLTLGDRQRWVINPGGVGQTRGFRVAARFAVLDAGQGTVSFRSVPYDVRRCRRELRRHGLNPRSYQLRPSPWRRIRRLTRNALKRSA